MSRAAFAIALVISLFSTGAVIVHNCHTEKQAISAHAHHDHSTGPVTGVAGEIPLGELCVSVIFFALIFGGRLLALRRKSKFIASVQIFWRNYACPPRPPRILVALSITQLGTFRI